MFQMQEYYIEPYGYWHSISRAGCIELCIQNCRPNAISEWMPSWSYTIIVMHTWAYKRNEKYIFTAFEHRENETRSFLSNPMPRYLYWFTDFTFWPPSVSNGVTVLFALLALNVIHTVLLQFKIIPCDSALAWHTSSILCSQRTLRQNTQISSANIKWFNKTTNITPCVNVV